MSEIPQVNLQATMANLAPGEELRFIDKDGVADYMEYRAEELARKGFPTRLIGGPNPNSNGVPKVFRLPTELSIATYPSAGRVLDAIAQAVNVPGTTVTNTGDIWKMITNPLKPDEQSYRRFMQIMQNKPLVWDTHNVGSVAGFPYQNLKPEFVDRFSPANHGMLVAGSQWVRQEAMDFGIPDTGVRQVYPAIDTQLVDEVKQIDNAKLRAELGMNQTEKYLTTVSRIADGKNMEKLLEAWHEMQTTRFDSQGNPNPDHPVNKVYGTDRLNLIVIGGASEGHDQDSYIQALASANAGSDQRTRGTVIPKFEISDDRLVAKYTAAADLYILPSQREGYNLAVLRALAIGRSTIVYDQAQRNSGLGELIIPGQTGTVFDAFTGDSLAAAIHTAEAGKETLVAGATAHINSGGRLLNHEQATDKMLEIYDEVTQENPFKIVLTSTLADEEP